MAECEDPSSSLECEAGGVIRSHMAVAEAAANGSRSMVEFLLDNGAIIDEPGKDGTTALCAAALWGNDAMVTFLLDKGANILARNDGTGWTALHAAAFQEHGRVVRVLLERGADPFCEDLEERTPVDYASISEAIWPHFAARGCERSRKSDLVAKGIIRKVQDDNQPEHGFQDNENIASFSRPGSSYVRAQNHPPVPSVPSSYSQSSRRSNSSRKEAVKSSGPIDPLGDAPSHRSNQRLPSLQGLVE